MNWKFEEGQRVVKPAGYPFPGIVEARFWATQIDGTQVQRYVVNQTVVMHAGIGPSGLLHIFSPEQLEADGGGGPSDAAKLLADFEEAVMQFRSADAVRLRKELIRRLEGRK